MPSLDHEGTVELFRRAPALAVAFIPEADRPPGWRTIELLDSNLSQRMSTEYRADLALVLRDAAGRAAMGIVVEVQQRRKRQKRYAWPAYVGNVWSSWRIPCEILVVTPSRSVARWARRPVRISPRSFVTPLVIGPAEMPRIEDVERARALPELAVLSARQHGKTPEGEPVVRAALAAVGDLDEERARFYSDFILAGINEALRKKLEALMEQRGWPYPVSDFAKRHYFRGHAEGVEEGMEKGMEKGLLLGVRQSLLAALEGRGFVVSDAARGRVAAATEIDVLNRWLRRALTAASLEDVFEP